jgi:tRNA-dependent cyclodipeptide synthase
MTSTPNVTTTENSTSLAGILSFLNENNVKYRVCHFAPSYTDEEIQHELSRLGMGLLEAVPLDVLGQGLILAIIPSSLALDFVEFSKLLAPRVIRLLAPDEIRQRFSFINPTNNIPPLGGLFGLESFLSPLIDQNHTVGFFANSRNILVTLDAREFLRLVRNASPIPIPTRPKYRAYASADRRANGRCILGVSLENADFHTAKLVTITDWICGHYTDCVVMLGDGLHRITLQMDTNVSESEALEYSKWLARDFVYSQLSVFSRRGSSCRFEFKFCSEIQSKQSYQNYHSELEALCEENKEFRNSIRAFSSDFLRRKPQRREHLDTHIQMSRQYILEELGVICCLAQDFPCTFVYPGSLTILEEIAEGKHPCVPACLLQMDYVELKLKGRQKNMREQQ